MATKAELLEQAKQAGFNVNTKTTKADLESMLGNREQATTAVNKASQEQAPEKQVADNTPVVVNENENGEATSGTTLDGDQSQVHNTDSIPQNHVAEIKTTPHDELPPSSREVAKAADEARTAGELEFANESNPNMKGRKASAAGEDFDQDGNLRTEGYSYGVAPDDPSTTPQGGTNNEKDQ